MSYKSKSKHWTKKPPTLIQYEGRVKFLRQWLPHGFDASDGYDIRKSRTWSSARKKTINDYYDAISQLTSREVYIYRPRSKQNQAVARDSMGLSHLKKITVGFIQVPSEITDQGKRVAVKPKVKIRKGILKVEYKGFRRDAILFARNAIDNEQLAADPVETVLEMLDGLDYSAYAIIAGLHEVGKGAPRMMQADTAADTIKQYINRYVPGGGSGRNCDPNDSGSHHWKNWLFGVYGYKFKGPNELLSYARTIRAQSKLREAATARISKIKKQIDYRLEKIRLLSYNKKLSPEKKRAQVLAYKSQINKQEKIINDIIIARAKGQ